MSDESVAEVIQKELDELPNKKRSRAKEFEIISKHTKKLQSRLDDSEEQVEYLERNHWKVKSYYNDEIDRNDHLEEELARARTKILELEPQGYANGKGLLE